MDVSWDWSCCISAQLVPFGDDILKWWQYPFPVTDFLQSLLKVLPYSFPAVMMRALEEMIGHWQSMLEVAILNIPFVN